MEPTAVKPDGSEVWYIVQRTKGQPLTLLCRDGDWVPILSDDREEIETARSVGAAEPWAVTTIESAERIAASCQKIAKRKGQRNVFGHGAGSRRR